MTALTVTANRETVSVDPDVGGTGKNKNSTKGTTTPNENTKQRGNFFTRLLGEKFGNRKKRRTLISKGVYFDSSRSSCDDPAIDYTFSHESANTLDTLSTREDARFSTWSPSNELDHEKGVPAIVRRPEYDRYNEADDRKLLKKIMDRAKKLPQEPGKYASNHMMVNSERTQRSVPPLRRERRLDQIAREHAQLMADERKLFHTDSPIEIRNRLLDDEDDDNEPLSFKRLGMNVGKGMRAQSISEIHRHMMAALAERNNIYDKRFHKMGMGTATAENGVLYLCQVFVG